nr:MAG TPA: hypothetical protein [Caudoviricetes sp.]
MLESAFKCGQISTHFYKSVSKIDRYLLYFNPFSTNQFSSTLAISTLFALAKAKSSNTTKKPATCKPVRRKLKRCCWKNWSGGRR